MVFIVAEQRGLPRDMYSFWKSYPDIFAFACVCKAKKPTGTHWIKHSAAFPQAHWWVSNVLIQMPAFPGNSLTVCCMLHITAKIWEAVWITAYEWETRGGFCCLVSSEVTLWFSFLRFLATLIGLNWACGEASRHRHCLFEICKRKQANVSWRLLWIFTPCPHKNSSTEQLVRQVYQKTEILQVLRVMVLSFLGCPA